MGWPVVSRPPVLAPDRSVEPGYTCTCCPRRQRWRRRWRRSSTPARDRRGLYQRRDLVRVRWAGRWCHDRQCWHQIARSSPVIRVLAVPGGNGGVVDGDVHQRQRATGAVCTNAVISSGYDGLAGGVTTASAGTRSLGRARLYVYLLSQAATEAS